MPAASPGHESEPLELGGRRIALDAQGYLVHAQDWSPAVARELARRDGLELGAGHWELIELLRGFYASHEIVPSMRPLVKLAARELGPEKGSSVYLLHLFPGNPALRASRIAGLPRPANCF